MSIIEKGVKTMTMKTKLIVRGPSVINSFSRCECDYRLLDLGEGLFAIEWAPYYEMPYAIVYSDGVKAHKDFEDLATKKGSYQRIEDDTTPENILTHCPWKPGDEYARIDRIGDEFWNIFTFGGGCRADIIVGPYDTLEEAAQNLSNDLDICGDNPGVAQ